MAVEGSNNASRTGRHRKVARKQAAVCQWLRVGAVGFGLGAAVTAGQGTAAAAPNDPTHNGTHASSDSHGSSGGNAGRPHSTINSPQPNKAGAPSAAPVIAIIRRDVAPPSPAAPTPNALLKAVSQPISVATMPAQTAAESSRATFVDVITDTFVALSGAAREVDRSANRRRASDPSATTDLDTGVSPGAAVGSSRRTPSVSNSARAALTEAQSEAADATFNMTAGWVPLLGTVYNALSLATDFGQFVNAVVRADGPDITDEITDMAIDIVGLVPVVGGPLAATIYHLRAGTNPVNAVNHAPVLADASVTFTGTDEPSGMVTGRVNATDPDGDKLTYALGNAPDAAVGTATVNPLTGTFTFTPTPQARFSAWVARAQAKATFTINVSDGQYTALVTVTAVISPSAAFKVDVLATSDQHDLGNQGLAVAPDGRFYSTTYQAGDAGNVVVLDSDGKYLTTIDIASAIPAAISTAYDVVVGVDGRVFVSSETASTPEDLASEAGHGAVVVIDPSKDYAVSLFAQIDDPASALAVDASGRVFVANWNNDDITVLNSDGSLNRVIGSSLLSEGDDSGAAGMALGTGGQLYLSKPALGVIKVVNSDGSLAKTLDVGGTPWSVAFGSYGATYVTDATDGTVGALDSDGRQIRTITLPGGSNPTDLAVGAGGTVYVSYTDANGSAIAAISAVAIPTPDTTVLGQQIPGLPSGTGISDGLLIAGGVAYQTVIGTDPATGKTTTTVAVIAANGTTTFAHADGVASGSVVVGQNGVAYQAIVIHDDATDAPTTRVLVISPSGASTLTDLFSGSPSSSVVIGKGGAAYQVLYRLNDDESAYTTTVIVIKATDATPHDIAGAPANIASDGPGAIAGPDGTVYVTTVDLGGSPSEITTHVTAFTDTTIKTYTIAGYATDSVAIGADGTVYQTVGIDSGTDADAYVTAIAVLKDTGFVTLPDTVPGLSLGSPQSAADGRLYQATMVVDTDTGSMTTTIATITNSGLTTVFEGVPGTLFGPAGNLLPVVVGPDGALYLTTVGSPDPDTGAVVTYLTTKMSGGESNSAELMGQPVGSLVARSGVAYLTTYDSEAGITRVAVITAVGTAMHIFDGYPGDPQTDDLGIGGVVIGADGTAYQTVAVSDEITGKYNTLVAVFSPSGAETHVYAGIPSGPAVVDADGTVYQSVSRFDIPTQTVYTTVLELTGSGMTPVGGPIVGQAAGSVVVGADGHLYQTVYSERGTGEYFTAVHMVDPSVPAALSAAAVAVAVATQAASATHNLTLVGDPIGVGGDPEAVAVSPDGRYVYVTNEDGYLSIIDTHSNNSIRTVNTGNDSISVAVHGNFAYVTNRGSNSVSVINMSNLGDPNFQPQAINVGVGSAPFGLAVTPNGKFVYVANSGDGTVSVIDARNNSVIDQIHVGGNPTAIVVSPNGTRVYVTNTDGGMSVIDTASNVVKGTIAVYGGYGVAVSPDNKYVYVTANGVSAIDVTTGVVTQVESVFSEWIAVSPSGNRVYVTNTGGNTVSVIDGNTNAVLGDPLPVGYVAGVALSPNSQRLYAVLAGGGGSSVLVISTADSGTAISTATKPVPAKPVNPKPPANPKPANTPPPNPLSVLKNLSSDLYAVAGSVHALLGNDSSALVRALGSLTKDIQEVKTLAKALPGGVDKLVKVEAAADSLSDLIVRIPRIIQEHKLKDIFLGVLDIASVAATVAKFGAGPGGIIAGVIVDAGLNGLTLVVKTLPD
ncbi:beta-propeller fold lactonase family protein [Mycolicibacterium sp. Dal123E01]|uniref:beta-propeller fold lactonase family protein n=1 Tax=Mycolicibacterium sp. Dal123E01 TaxID=3457578 RepID=UPI00403EBF81